MDVIDVTNHRARINVLRTALRAKYGTRQYRIIGHHGFELVHVRGHMPNSHTFGWWLLGNLIEAELRLGIIH